MRINVHTHIFNLPAVTTPLSLAVVRDRVAREIDIDLLGDAAADLAEDLVRDLAGFNEEALLRRLLERLSGSGDFRSALDEVADEVPQELRGLLAGELEDRTLRLLRRTVDWVVRRFRRRGDDHRRTDLHDVLETVRIAAQADIGNVADWLMRQLDPADAVVALTLDITDGQSDDLEIFEQQLSATSDAIFAYPGRLLPFVAVNPLRPEHFEIMTDALENRGFIGVKLYPSLGYAVDSDAMMRVYAYCHEHKVPILMHCNQSGFVVSEDSFQLADPAHWPPILRRFPDLNICFAHFGGSGELTQTVLASEAWAQTILGLMRQHRGVFADVSSHSRPMEGDDLAEQYFRRLANLLDDPVIGERLLFGTDFWLIRPRLSEINHWRFFEERLSPELFERLAEENNRRFLGLDGGNDAVDAFVDFAATNPDRFEAPAAEWLLAAIEARPGGVRARAAIEEVTARRSPARSFVVRLWQELLDQVSNRTLADGLDVDLDGDLDDLGTSFRGGRIGFEVGAGLAIQVFGDPRGTDEDGILLPLPPGSGVSELETSATQLQFTDDRAWLKYRVEAKLSGNLDVDSVGLGIDAGKGVVLTDYRAHRPSDLLQRAIRTDLARPRFALSRSDVQRLGDGDAVGFELRGHLDGRITLSWRDVFTQGIDALSALIPGAPRITLRVDTGAQVSAGITLKDDFRVVFSRHDAAFQVAVRKARARGRSITASLAVGLELEDSGLVRFVLDQLLEQAFGENLDRVRALLERPATDTKIEEELLQQLEDRFQVAGLERVRETLAGLEGRLTDEIHRIAREKIQAGFLYEYRRMETHATLFEARFGDRVLEQVHHQLAQGDLTGLLERAAEAEPEVDLRQYLRRRELVRRHAWGFSLGPIAGSDVGRSVLREHQDVEGRKAIGYLGTRSYTASWSGTARWGWSVDLRADMPEFRQDPTVDDFEYGLAFEMTWNRRLTKTALRECLDAAVLWRALPAGAEAFGTEEQRLVDLGLRDKRVPITLELVFDHEVLATVLPAAVAAGDEGTAAALAAAMPYRKSQSHGEPAARRRAYAETWLQYLQASPERQGVEREWALRSANRLRSLGLRSQVRMEHGNDDRWSDRLWTFGGMISINGSPSRRLRDFRRGLELLEAARRNASGESPEQIEIGMFRPMQRFWQQTHHVRALGVLLLDAARSAGALGGVRATLVVEHEREGRTEALILSRD